MNQLSTPKCTMCGIIFLFLNEDYDNVISTAPANIIMLPIMAGLKFLSLKNKNPIITLKIMLALFSEIMYDMSAYLTASAYKISVDAIAIPINRM